MKKGKEKIKKDINQNNNSENLEEVNEENTEENNNENSGKNEELVKEEIEETEKDKLREEVKILKEEKIRVLAEMENLRKRFDREKIDSIKYGSVNFARDILSPGDNLERALSAINKEEDHTKSIKNLIEGLLMVKKELSLVLEKNGVKKIDTINKKFDPNLHQAMMEVEKDDIEEGVVVQEIQPGYMMHDRLLRPAMVGVSKKSKKEKGTEPTENADPDSKDV